MSDFLPRTGPIATLISATEHGRSVRPPSAAKAIRNGLEAGAKFSSGVTDRSAGAADYAKIQANIADVLARIKPAQKDAGSIEFAERAIVALMPNPVITLPMPPTDSNIVAFVAQIGQSMARQAAQTRAAQANATPIMVEAAAH